MLTKAQALAVEGIELASMLEEDPDFAEYAQQLDKRIEAKAAAPQKWLSGGLFSGVKAPQPKPH